MARKMLRKRNEETHLFAMRNKLRSSCLSLCLFHHVFFEYLRHLYKRSFTKYKQMPAKVVVCQQNYALEADCSRNSLRPVPG